MAFYSRNRESRRLLSAFARERRQLIIVYGRRRTGKSTLLQEVLDDGDVYFQSSQSTASYQRERLLEVISTKLPGLRNARFQRWEDLFAAINANTTDRFRLVIDEFPYLVSSSPELPSVLQVLVDQREYLRFDLILCGSSQQMMQGYVLQSTAPLYGRADEILKLTPLTAGWLIDHLPAVSDEQRITEYATWGGIPRYWELRSNYDTYEAAVRNNVLSPMGVLHEEPTRLLLEEVGDPSFSTSLIGFIALGAHRVSEIGSRMERPSTSLSRPLRNLMEMGMIKRVTPFRAKRVNNKVSLYQIADPFLRFHYRYVYPNLSDLSQGDTEYVWQHITEDASRFVATVWEDLSREVLRKLPDYGEFAAPGNWWGTNVHKQRMELDMVTMNKTGDVLLVGECKWSTVNNAEHLRQELLEKAKLLPFYNNQQIIPLIFARSFGRSEQPEFGYLPKDVLPRLRI